MINILRQNIMLYFEWVMDILWTFKTLAYYANARVPCTASILIRKVYDVGMPFKHVEK